MPWQIEAGNGIHLPQIDWHLDARHPVARCFVSHAHSDHIAPHKQVMCSPGTARLLAARLPGERELLTLPFGTGHRLADGTRVVLHPAGHIFGSAQFWAENEHGSLLFTGDFKLRPGSSAEPCATPHAGTLIMETTYGRPHYVFPPTAQVLAAIVRFCRDAIEDGEVPILYGYSLGKSQELLGGLAGAGLPIMLHAQTWKISRLYEEMGVVFPPYEKLDPAAASGHVAICPPGASSAWMRQLPARRTAAVTGWAVDPGAAFRMQCDEVFPLSDHAGFDDLLRFVERVKPERVFTVHGFAADFARTLRQRGIEAWALGLDNQLELDLGRTTLTVPALEPAPPADAPPAGGPAETAPAPDTFARFALTADAVRDAAGKLQKTELLAGFFVALPDAALGPAALYFTGRALPQSSGRALQLGWSLLRRAVLAVSGQNESAFRGAYRQFGDSGDAAGALLAGHTAPEPWPLEEAAAWFEALAAARGPVAKLELLENRLRHLTPREAKYLVKIVTGDLRIGLKEGLVEEAIAHAFARHPAAVREANMRCGNIALVARAARAGTLEQIELRVFHPLQFMLASPEPDAAAVVARLGEEVWLEEKYDGIRCQVHVKHGRAELYSRDLRNISAQFPELVRAAAGSPHAFIADGELLAWRDGRALPFLELQRRLGRRGDDFFLGAEIPVSLWLYDLLWLDGRLLLPEPLRERRALLESLTLAPGLALAPREIVRGVEAIEAAFVRSRTRGNEGLMIKDPASLYTPGRRGFGWLKLKKAYGTLDVVVTAVEYGHGKRHGVLSDYTFSVRDTDTGALRTIGKAYSGLTDVEIAKLTGHFLENTIEVRGHQRTVAPDTVLEIAFDTIQPSTRHDSGFALRFPRIVRIRDDKTPAEIDTLDTCRRLAAVAAAAGVLHA